MATMTFPTYEEDVDTVLMMNVEVLEGDPGESIMSQVLVLLKREGGALLAFPSGALSADALAEAAEGNPFSMFGPHTTFQVPSRESFAEEVIEVLVVDADTVAFNYISVMPSPVPEGVTTFAIDPAVLPAVEPLMTATRAWLLQSQEDPALVFYSAVEDQTLLEEPHLQPPMMPSPKTSAKPKAKRITTTSLAEQLGSISEILPLLTAQVASLKDGQEELRAKLEAQAKAVPPRASQQPVSAPLQSFAKMIGSPPRTRALVAQPPHQDPLQAQIEEGGEGMEEQMPGGGILAQAVLEQSRALTNLVSQLQQGGDPLLDGQQSASGISLGSRGAQGREKLQLELANRSGNFFLAVVQNACRRMKPATRPPTSLEAAQNMELSMVTYLEKFGGYGACREMGLVQYSLAHVFDAALNNDMEGAREHLALTMTAIEQAVQDGNRWDLAYQLTLLEEPPTQLWAFRSAAAQSRLRAFAPLCAQRWATVALAHAKELDYIQNRRAEMNKKTYPVPAQENSNATPKPKPKRKPKWQGGGTAGSSNAADAGAPKD